MAEHSKAPSEFHFIGDVASNWRLWKQKFELYLLASDKVGKTDKVKIAVLLNLLGDEALQVYNTFEYDAGEDSNKLETVLDKFEAYCNPIKNMVYEHYKFFKRDQNPNETVDQFVTALRQLASTCEFKEKDVLIRDRIVLGIRDPCIQEKLLQNPNLGLNEVIQISRSMECSAETQKVISRESVNVSLIKSFQHKLKNVHKPCGAESSSGIRDTTLRGSTSKSKYECSRCGFEHVKGKCPAYNKLCSKCRNRGHYRKFCSNFDTNVHEVAENSDSHSDDFSENVDFDKDSSDQFVWTITDPHVNSIEWFEKVEISGCKIKLKIDTGSQVNILNFGDFSKIHCDSNKLSRSSTKLSSYLGHTIEVIGQIKLNCSLNSMCKKFLFYVVNSGQSSSLLGLEAASELGLVGKTFDKRTDTVSTIQCGQHIAVENILTKHRSVFSGIGRVNKQYKITLREDAVPVVSAARKIPAALRDKVKSKLDEMVAEKIIEPVTEPTDWVHPIVLAPKSNGDVRICMDPRTLNTYIKRENFPIPTTDALFAELAGAKYFTLLDASSAFLQIPLNHNSSLLCTVATTFGRYRYLRLPYGISSAPEIFQRFMYETLDGVAGCLTYFDDVFVFGDSLETHNNNLDIVLTKLSNSGLTLNYEKSKFCVTQVKFLGHIISDSGISPDENKMRAIRNMQPPKNKKDLQRFLGMIVYLSKFIPNLSQETSAIRNLLSGKNEWKWTEQEQKCFDRLKSLVSEKTKLSYYNPGDDVVLSVDASPFGIGAVIYQKNGPVEFASITLTPTQQKYNHIEKELLALTYGCERFHYYLYGRQFKIETDHRPLLGLLKKTS